MVALRARDVCVLNNETLWENLFNLSTARNKESSRLWIDYFDLPAEPPDASEENINILEKMLIEHFQESKRSETCKVDSYIRKHQYYFFATLCDAPTFEEVLEESLQNIAGANGDAMTTADEKSEQSFTYVPLVHPFRIIFVYDECGQFSIYGELSKSDFDIIARKLVKALVNYDGMFQRIPKTAYCLEGLKDRNFDFKIESADSIESIKVTSLTFSPVDDDYTKLCICNRHDDLYERLEQYLNRERLDNDSIDLKRVTLTFKMCESFRHFRSFSFDIALDACSTKSMEDRQRELGEKYIRKLAFIRFPDITLNAILQSARSEIPVISNRSFGGISLQMLTNMLDFGLIEATGDATEISDGDISYPIVQLTNELGDTVPGYLDTYGNPHILNPIQIKRYRVIFAPLVKCIRDELNCRGEVDELLSGKVWHLGLAGSEHRDTYLVRNWNTDKEVQNKIKSAKPGSLVFYLGREPEVVQIGCRRSDAKEDGQHMEAQYYRVGTLMEYTQEAGYVFRADIVRQNLRDMQAAVGPKSYRGKVLPGKQETYQRNLEVWTWTWFDARLKAAKTLTDYSGEPDPDVNPAWVDNVYLTQKQVCEKAGVDNKAFTRAKAAWKKDRNGFGQFFYKVSEQFIMRRPQKDRANDGREAELLNDFYKENKAIISEMRKQRPHIL